MDDPPVFIIVLLLFSLSRLSSENVSSPYDDRLDKIDPEGSVLPGPARNRWARKNNEKKNIQEK